MIAEGLLPNLAAIRRSGVSGPFRSTGRPLSPPIWTSVVTGRSPEVHGIENVYLYDIDALEGVIDENLEQRRRAAERAKKVITAPFST